MSDRSRAASSLKPWRVVFLLAPSPGVLCRGGMKLYHRDLGGAGKPPMIVLHGLLGSSRNWLSTGADLSAQFHVFALDLRNHGRSPHDSAMSYEALSADVIEWMDAQQTGRASLMGHSLGGKVAMLVACRHVERVDQLIVVDIAPRDYLSAAHRAEFAAMNELDLRTIQSRGEAELRFEARVPDWPMRKFLTTNLERDTESGAWKWAVNLPVLTAQLEELEQNPLTASDRFEGPTLFIAGGKSHYLGPTDWAAIISHFPTAQFEVIADSGHNPHMDARLAFVKAVFGKHG